MSGLVPSFPGQKWITMLNCDRNSEHQCHETYFSSPLLTLIPSAQCPISTFESSLVFRFDSDSTSIRVWTFETVTTSLITLLPVVVHPIGSPHSPHPGESKTTTHICTLTVQKCNTLINQSTNRSDDITVRATLRRGHSYTKILRDRGEPNRRDTLTQW